MVGILVSGDNHFILRGPLPDAEIAHKLVRHWSFVQIGSTTPGHVGSWEIVTREFRENLEWAVIVQGDGEISAAVKQLLSELSSRGIITHDFRFDRR